MAQQKLDAEGGNSLQREIKQRVSPVYTAYEAWFVHDAPERLPESGLPKNQTLADKVERVIHHELSSGEPSVERVAQQLQLTRRTFSRRLAREGTTFTTILNETRRKLALRYITDRRVANREIANLLGFSRTAAFFRAFKRWTGTTPGDYRRSQRLPKLVCARRGR